MAWQTRREVHVHVHMCMCGYVYKYMYSNFLSLLVRTCTMVPHSLPPLTGAISADEKHKCKPEDQVGTHSVPK